MQVTSLGTEKGILLKLSILPKQLPWLFVGKFHLIINWITLKEKKLSGCCVIDDTINKSRFFPVNDPFKNLKQKENRGLCSVTGHHYIPQSPCL